MDKNSNFYMAIEEAIIKPCFKEMKNLEEPVHKFSKKYNEKILEIIEMSDKKRTPDLFGRKKLKMNLKTISIIVAAAIIAGTITVAASESVRHMIYKLFIGDDSSYVSEEIEETYPIIITQPPITDIPKVTNSDVTSTTTALVSTTLVSSSSSSESSILLTSGFPERITETVISDSLGGNRMNQRPSMQFGSRPQSITVTTTPNKSEEINVTTAPNTGGGTYVTSITTTCDVKTEIPPISTTVTTIAEVTAPSIVESTVPIEVTDIITSTKTTTVSYYITTQLDMETIVGTYENINILKRKANLKLSEKTYTTTIITDLKW